MSKFGITLLVLILILSLFVSCDADKMNAKDSDGVAYIRFSGRQSRDSLSITYENEDYDTLYWFYEAKKEDSYGTTGQTTGETAYNTEDGSPVTGLERENGTIGPFSQGIWTFNVYAYKCPKVTDDDGSISYPYNGNTRTRIYKGTTENVTLLAGETKSIGVTVTGVGESGTLILSGLYFNSDGAIASAGLKLTRTGSNDTTETESGTGTEITDVPALTLTKTAGDETGKYSIAFSTDTPFTLEKGEYEGVVKGYAANSTEPSFTSETINFVIYGDLTTTLSGLLSEKTEEGN